LEFPSSSSAGPYLRAMLILFVIASCVSAKDCSVSYWDIDENNGTSPAYALRMSPDRSLVLHDVSPEGGLWTKFEALEFPAGLKMVVSSDARGVPLRLDLLTCTTLIIP